MDVHFFEREEFGNAGRDELRFVGFGFVAAHKKVFVIEQNRDAQFKSLMMIELGTNADKLISVLNYDGTPITADFIFNRIKAELMMKA